MLGVYNTITGSRPSHIHCNGLPADACRHGREFFAALLSELDKEARPPPRRLSDELEVVTFSTYDGPTLVERSLARWGVRPIIYGRDEGPWQNRHKIVYALEHCRRSTAKYVMFSDATDAVFLNHPNDIPATFKQLDVPALIALERNSWPPWGLLTKVERRRHPGRYRHGNSGGIIGEREFLLRFLECAQALPISRIPWDDQGRMRIAALAMGVVGDERCEIFQTLHMLEPGDLEIHRDAEPTGDDARPVATHATDTPRVAPDAAAPPAARVADDRVTALVVCVDYDDFLRLTLPTVRAAVARVVVATAARDVATQALCGELGVECVIYPGFENPAARFDKAGALNFLLDHARPTGWALALDADIAIPGRIDAAGLRRKHLYSARRRMIATSGEWREYQRAGDLGRYRPIHVPIRNGRAYGCLPTINAAGLAGYFQLWHVPTYPTRRFPASRHGNASEYDVAFALNWGEQERFFLPDDVPHLGPNRENWNGRRTPRWRDAM